MAPSTPTPHRFLVPKRSARPRSETPKPLQAGSQQFQATPRFSLHSTPRATGPVQSSSTPAPPTAFQRQRNIDSISDDLGSSPPSPRHSHGLNDSIEFDSVPVSSQIEFPVENSDDEEPDAPSPKRRRLSVLDDPDREVSLSPVQRLIKSDQRELELTHAAEVDPTELAQLQSAQQPTFRKAPRFKQVELAAEQQHEPLPDAFSPHRRGAKYVPGGLAAELRDWLMDIEATTGSKRDGEWLAKILVSEARTSPGMILARGKRVHDDEDQGPAEDPGTLNIILAGEGRLIGLARRNEVAPGSVIGIAKPVWEVDIQMEGRWAVACDWVVL
ncbi:uncharacterized protein BCR38DRAFT_110185 [Pseudomassariella vexata]|uniref:Uncharacterized protein n=1 Tax=Pseudomassariella vexata TaxID=1141098 RepID=A0A1Y2DF12_9PEZI|nr:uncharacterized protein BCR38DRAFT_110185 [Pseudomassariella vexata]ORY57255.1 hypothetical protein BCR38DRAFT_110185 [Pseudomassariella vexata]